MNKEVKQNRGGKTKGAGRKHQLINPRNLTISVPKEDKDKFKEIYGLGGGNLIRNFIKEKIKKRKEVINLH